LQKGYITVGNVRQPTKEIFIQSDYHAYSSWCSLPVLCLAICPVDMS